MNQIITQLISAFTNEPLLATIALIAISIIIASVVTLRMKGIIKTIISFFKGLYDDIRSVKDEVNVIRKDQVLSNEERREQKSEIHEIKHEIHEIRDEYKHLKKDVEKLNKFHANSCINRDNWRDGR